MKNSSLRQRAAGILKKSLPRQESDFSLQDPMSLVHELQIHQIELEMQNEELLKSNSLLEESVEKYIDLYQNAPCGYLTLDHEGNIIEANLMASHLFGVKRDSLIGENITTFISPKDQGKAKKHYFQALELNSTQVTEICSHNPISKGRYLQLQTTSEPPNSETQELYKSILTDITERKIIENEARVTTEVLVQTNKDLEDFAFLASLDLQEPLRKLITFVRTSKRAQYEFR
ncbi:MAG: PAS domain S-box-containing protein [Nitrospinales bacterium]|jgi:PAS domain S-box-containing protein